MKEIGLLACIAFIAVIPAVLIFRVNEELDTEKAEENKVKKILPWRALLLLIVASGFGAACMSRFYYEMSWRAILPVVFLLAELWPVAWADWRHHVITNRSLLIMLAFRVLILGAEALLAPEYMVYILLTSVIGALALMFASFLCRLVASGSVGYGDIKLLGVVGLYMGTDKLAAVILPSLLVLFIASVYLLAVKKADRKTELAFAPFLLIGTLLGMILMAA